MVGSLRVGELLVPLAEALRRELLRGSYLQADETPVGVQMHDGNGSNHLAYLWQYGQPHRAVVFDFRMGRRMLHKVRSITSTGGWSTLTITAKFSSTPSTILSFNELAHT